MADLTSTRQKIQDALDEADMALGQQTTSQKLTDLQAQVTTLTNEKAALQSTLNQIRALLG